jgi:hypothetical protein
MPPEANSDAPRSDPEDRGPPSLRREPKRHDAAGPIARPSPAAQATGMTCHSLTRTAIEFAGKRGNTGVGGRGKRGGGLRSKGPGMTWAGSPRNVARASPCSTCKPTEGSPRSV